MSLKDWKLKLRYGKTTTPYKHFTAISNCEIGQLDENFSCPTAQAYVGMKMWATDADEAAEIFESIGRQVGFIPFDKIEIYSTDAAQPPKEEPYGYDIQFTPYDESEN